MRRKFILLASVAGAALVAAEPAFGEGFYYSTSGGANFVKDRDGSFTTNFSSGTYNAHFDFETGFMLSSAIGLELDRWLHGLKVEIEGSYRRNKIGGNWTFTESSAITIPTIGLSAVALSSGSISGHLSTFALMSNAWYEFDIGTRFKPYIGGGVGWARSKLDGAFQSNRLLITSLAINPFQGFSVENSGFAYQLGAGITSQIMPGVSLGLGYRYFDGPDIELSFFSGKAAAVGPAAFGSNSINFNNVSHSVALSLSVDID
ncbi:MAG: outer membrane beta-barrel protein [Alphaproteobacteria bacterium]|nr:outer membrane beta-barrel protein [Alphaproteobacteria bacterium]